MDRKPSVTIIDTVYGTYEIERERLAAIEADVTIADGSDPDEVSRACETANAVLVNLYPMDRPLIERMKHCRIIARYGVGVDNVDIDAATSAGIWVANVREYATEDVSDHAIALLMGCERRLVYRDRRVRAGGWSIFKEQKSRRTAGKTLGIIGFGAIGSAVARKLSGFGFSRVLACDPYIDQDAIRNAGAEPTDHDTVFRESDYVTLHVPLNDETRHMVNARALSLMKAESVLVNTARGGVVDTAAVVSALRNGEIGYAGLDVHESEPLEADSPLFELDNVILSDHCAWYTEESIVELRTKTADNVIAVLRGGRPNYPVNEITDG